MKQPDAFEQMVGQVGVCRGTEDHALGAKTAVKLLRRQHARVLSLVKRETRWQLDRMGHLTTMPDGEWINRDTLIKALAKMKKGKP